MISRFDAPVVSVRRASHTCNVVYGSLWLFFSLREWVGEHREALKVLQCNWVPVVLELLCSHRIMLLLVQRGPPVGRM